MSKLNKTLRVCKLGHKYYKSSDCPVCPICESGKNTTSRFLDEFSAPARRALESIDVHDLESLRSFTKKEIVNLHGMGPSSLKKIDQLLAETNLKYKET
jgi:DNA-directed RNA polymerase alpha subunit